MSAALMYRQLGVQESVPEIIRPAVKKNNVKKKKKMMKKKNSKKTLTEGPQSPESRVATLPNGGSSFQINNPVHSMINGDDSSEHTSVDSNLDDRPSSPLTVASDSTLPCDKAPHESSESRDCAAQSRDSHVASTTVERALSPPRDSPDRLACNYAAGASPARHFNATEVKVVQFESVSLCSDPGSQNTNPPAKKGKKRDTSTSPNGQAKKKRKGKNGLNKFVLVVDSDQIVGDMSSFKRSDTLNGKDEAKQLFQWLIHPVKSDQFFK